MEAVRPDEDSGAGALLFRVHRGRLGNMLDAGQSQTRTPETESLGVENPVTGCAETESDESLMQRYCAGDAKAFDQLYARYRKPLFGFLYNHSQRQRHEVEEVFQEAWLKVIRNRRRYDSGQAFQPWLYAIARNCLIDRWRHLGAVTSLHVSDDVAMQGASSNGLARPERLAASDDIQLRWQQALAALPAEQREAVLLKLETGMSLAEIAELTGTGRETVKSRLRYAMNRLREQLAEVFHD